MSVYTKLSDLLNTTVDMTALRNNEGLDSGADAIAGVDWFEFNGVPATNIYVGGDSYVGFGLDTKHLCVCNRDGKMWYLYRQEGVVGATKFLKIRWEGYSRYSSTSASYALKWELFLFDDGGIFINIVSVPSSSSYIGTSALYCGNTVYSLTVTPSTPIKYRFIPMFDGTFELEVGDYPAAINRVPYGSCEFTTEAVRAVTTVKSSHISWVATIPDDTSLRVLAKLSTGEYVECVNGEALPCITVGDDLSEETLSVKIEMSTSNSFITPVLRSIHVQIYDTTDQNVIALLFESGNTRSIQRAIGGVTVAYDGSGSLIGQGGPVLAFEQTFLPEGLDPKNNPNNVERISIGSIETSANLIRVYYKPFSETERINLVDVSVNAILTHIDDI